MKIPNELFFIEKHHLRDDKIFSFNLYIFNTNNKVYSLYLHANSPLDEAKEELLSLILKKGAKLAVDFKQKKTFLRTQEFTEEDIPSLIIEEHELEKKRQENIDRLNEKLEAVGEFNFKENFQKSVSSNNFIEAINQVHDEVITFSVKKSHTVSLAIYLCQIHLNTDNFLNRVVAVSYLLAKGLGFEKQEQLADIICGAYFCHMGMTQVKRSMIYSPQLMYSESEKKSFRQHPGLSLHILRKSKISLSNRCLNIIEQHHEREDGRGFPFQKKIDFIEPLALVLGAVSHIFEFSAGYVDGNTKPIPSIIRLIKSKTNTPGLEFQFGDKIYDSLTNLFNQNTDNKAA